jgi:hypothetical protein
METVLVVRAGYAIGLFAEGKRRPSQFEHARHAMSGERDMKLLRWLSTLSMSSRNPSSVIIKLQ